MRFVLRESGSVAQLFVIPAKAGIHIARTVRLLPHPHRLMDSRLRWQGKEWDILGMPWMLNCGMMLRLRKVDGGRCQHLWLAADSMDAAEWRDLRRMLLQQTTQG